MDELAGHTASTIASWRKLQLLTNRSSVPRYDPPRARNGGPELVEKPPNSILELDGSHLDIASVVAVADHGIVPAISDAPDLADRMSRSVDGLLEAVNLGWVIYGVNTGYGASADTRTGALNDHQLSILQHLQSGIIPKADLHPDSGRQPPHTIPRSWVRAAILIRINQCVRGHSAVRLDVIRRLVDLLRYDITPVIPLRGTVSASGDLMPMSYIVGAITGNPDIYVQLSWSCKNAIVSAPIALSRYQIPPVVLQTKEGLGVVNGTAPSAAVASIVLFDTQELAVLTQALTAFASEALAGNVEWTHSFIHSTRPHPGQAEVAQNLRNFLRDSHLVTGLKNRNHFAVGLCQDRYSTRTAPQWIGPYLEDLQLAQRQIEIELNSTSDNPLVLLQPRPTDFASANGSLRPGTDILSGGNFQAATVTSAMEKTRLAIQMLGRILFSQVSELVNPDTNNGLDANLNAVDDRAFTMKGIDVNCAAYMSELAALAHPVSAHVLSAEMHNQGVNSLALISARRTAEAADLLAHICACHLFVSCQAVELRVMHTDFLAAVAPPPSSAASSALLPALTSALHLSEQQAVQLQTRLSPLIRKHWFAENRVPAPQRCGLVADALIVPALQFLQDEGLDTAAVDLLRLRDDLRSELSAAADRTGPGRAVTPPSFSLYVGRRLGTVTEHLYSWVRDKLSVNIHMGLDDDPLMPQQPDMPLRVRNTIGTMVSRIYDSIRDRSLTDVLLHAIADQK